MHPWHTTTAGVGIAGEPYLSLPLVADDESLGAAVFRALAASKEQVPHPPSWKGLSAPRLVAAGLKSEAAFQTQARLVSISRDEESIVCEPSRNGGAKGPRKGFNPIPQLSVAVHAASPSVIVAQAIRAAFQRCA
jgi:hypothetical protein